MRVEKKRACTLCVCVCVSVKKWITQDYKSIGKKHFTKIIFCLYLFLTLSSSWSENACDFER